MNPAERAKSALLSFPPGGSHDETIRLGASFLHAGGDLADWLAWRAKDPDNKGEKYNLSQWRTYDRLDVGPGLLFHLAKQENEWIDPGADPDPPLHHTNGSARATNEEKRAETKQEQQEDSGERAVDLWLDGKRAHAHPYVIRKGLRDACDAGRLRVAANDPACLLVPIRALSGGAVVAVQRIYADGSKRTLGKLTPFPGCAYVIGELHDGVTVIGCEGMATGEAIAWACPTATVVVTIGVSREREVMGEIRARYPASPRVIVADRGRRAADATHDRPADHIESMTARAAQETRSAWVSMPPEAVEGFDAWDFATERSPDALAVWVAGAGRHEYEPRYKVLSGATITSQPIVDDLVDDVIPARGVGAVWGASAVAKSFLVLDLAASLTECRSFFGHDVFDPVPVLVLSLEGNNGLPRRYLAWEKHNGRPIPARLYTLTQDFSLLDPHDMDDLCEVIEACGVTGGVVFIDPLALATIGLEENSSADMGRAVAALHTLRDRTSCTVIAVHHTGKKQENGMRGSSNLPFLLDFHFEVTRDRQSGLREWNTGKQKESGDDLKHAFRLVPVVIGIKRNGKPLTSCVIGDCDAEMRGHEAVQKPEAPRGELQRIAFDVIGERLRRGENIAAGKGCPEGRPCVAFAEAVELLAMRLVSYESGKRRWKASKVIEAMQPKFYATDGTWLWLV
jgi:hypothetical protein